MKKAFWKRLEIMWLALIGRYKTVKRETGFNAGEVMLREPEPIDDRLYDMGNPADWNAVFSQIAPTPMAIQARLRAEDMERKARKTRWQIIRAAWRGEYDYLWVNDAAVAEIEWSLERNRKKRRSVR